MTELRPIALPNGWNFNVSPVEEVLPNRAIDEALGIIEKWQRIFPSAGTWVGKTHGVPSLFIRFEGTYDPEKGWGVFEIEDRPCGMGSTPLFNEFFRDRLEDRKEWPSIRWVVDPDRVTDDELWLGEGFSLEQALVSKERLLVRSRPENTAYHPLEDRAVSTISEEGNKRCLVDIGLGTIVRWVRIPDERDVWAGYIAPPVTTSMVIKPLQGTRCREVVVCLRNVVEKKVAGRGKVQFLDGIEVIKLKGDTVGTQRLEKVVREMGGALAQPFFPPMRFDHQPNMNAIYRFFFGFSPATKRYVPLGGMWTASKSLRVHGHDGVVFGPLTHR